MSRIDVYASLISGSAGADALMAVSALSCDHDVRLVCRELPPVWILRYYSLKRVNFAAYPAPPIGDVCIYVWDRRAPLARLSDTPSLVLARDFRLPPSFDGVVCRERATELYGRYHALGRAWYVPVHVSFELLGRNSLPPGPFHVFWVDPIARLEVGVFDSDCAAFLRASLPRAKLSVVTAGSCPGTVNREDYAAVINAMSQAHLACYFSSEISDRDWFLMIQACGLPIVCNRTGGSDVWVLDGETGYVCDSWTAFQDRCREIYADPALHKRLSEAAMKHARSYSLAHSRAAWSMALTRFLNKQSDLVELSG